MRMKMQNGRSPGKISLLGAIIASICIIVYLVALVSAAIRIYISVDQRRVLAEREFVNMADLASSAGNTLGFMSDPFIETINEALLASQTLEALIISSPGREYAFERQRGRSVRWVNNTPRFARRIDHSRQSLFRPLQIHGLRNVNMQAVATAVDYSQLSQILKETLFIIMGGLVLAFFTLLFEYLLGKSRDGKHSFQTIINKKSFAGKERIRSGHYAEAAAPFQPPVTDQPIEVTEEDGDAEDDSDDSDDNIEDMEDDEDSKDALAEVFHEEKSALKGLYSPRSNIGWEEYTNERLESELHRCASSELDLVLITMEFKNISDAGFIKVFAGDAAAFFGAKDLLYEKGTHGISAINPGINLETGVGKAEQFHSLIMERYSSVLKSKNDFYIGITSRSGRLVTADRMMFEANEALKRAKFEPNPILAFKSDPDKYRTFIRNSTS